ncbi:hypothetical protein HD806DRAFT_395882 [Xylariaceae sp. AK1471]|nr:hypothetical protein HD806DRAFT_395882 [Xylariaceae sp. AK1471]
MASAKKWLTQVFHSKRKNEQGTTQGASDSDNNTASTSASLIPNSPVVPSTSIQKLFPANKIYGLRDVYVPDDAVVDIVFLHGLNGRADTTFFHEGSGTFWPVDLLSKDVPNARILTYGYDAGVTNFFKPVGQNTLRDHASNLVNGLAAKRLDASYSRGACY